MSTDLTESAPQATNPPNTMRAARSDALSGPERLAGGAGAVVRHYRERRGWSRATLGKRTDYDRTYISRIESGARLPTRHALDRIATALRLTTREHNRLLVAGGYIPEELICVVLALTPED